MGSFKLYFISFISVSQRVMTWCLHTRGYPKRITDEWNHLVNWTNQLISSNIHKFMYFQVNPNPFMWSHFVLKLSLWSMAYKKATVDGLADHSSIFSPGKPNLMINWSSPTMLTYQKIETSSMASNTLGSCDQSG